MTPTAPIPRVALFADTFNELNGAANILRRLTEFARTRGLPFLCIRGGEAELTGREGDHHRVLQLKRSGASVPLDADLRFDPFFFRHLKRVSRELRDFRPDVIHVTGLNDVSQLGYAFAHFRDIMAVSTWHTNAHEYAASRLCRLASLLPRVCRERLLDCVESGTKYGLMKLQFLAQVQLAPNAELVDELRRTTRRPSFLLGRGVDTELFSPAKRTRPYGGPVRIGFVGRLRPEKNVRFFAEINAALEAAGLTDNEFVFVGEGSEESWLRANIGRARLPGVLTGEDLAREYADMDLFAFPSQTDAFGNVVLEAMASGVPVLVMPDGGPKFLVRDGETGRIAADENDFIAAAVELVREPSRLRAMGAAAARAAEAHSWTSIFEELYGKYRLATTLHKKVRASELATAPIPCATAPSVRSRSAAP